MEPTALRSQAPLAEDLLADALWSRSREGMHEPRLDAARRVLERLDDPHRRYRIIHVAGTNGKTTTSRLIESLLRATGLTTGLLTSPDLGRVNQRIAVRGAPVSASRLLCYWDAVSAAIEHVDSELESLGRPTITFFEAVTILGFYALAREGVEAAVIEVGLGGEWDATNVVDSEVSVITPIDIDHAEWLGGTLTSIAEAKSGIIKPRSVVVSAMQNPPAAAVIKAIAALRKARLFTEGADFTLHKRDPVPAGQRIVVGAVNGSYEALLQLHGAHQAQNAAVAIAATEALLSTEHSPLPREAVRNGLSQASSPGRFDWIAQDRPTPIVVDSAHNPHGVRAMTAALRELFPMNHLIGVVGVLHGKDSPTMFSATDGIFADLIVTTAPSRRAVAADALVHPAAATAARIVVEHIPETALRRAETLASSHSRAVIVVFGSITLASAALKFFETTPK